MALPTDDVHASAILPPPELLPDSFGRFRVLRTLAFGGMAQILLAEEAGSGRRVVLKRILPHYAANPEFVQFFIHEGRLGQRLRHPNLVETIEAGQVGGACYIALEYLRGQPTIELLRAAARQNVELPLGAAVRIVADAARGLHHAHVAVDDDGRPLEVVHRDVTPHNLFLCSDGTTKVLDFGIAKAASQLHHTRTGTIKGKFSYLSPEQIRGEPIDRRVDVFALGIVLHELLTLRPLFRGGNDAETLNRVLTMEVPPPERVRRGVPAGLGAVALRALQRERDRRLPSAEALADSIEAVAEAEGIDASPTVVATLLAQLCPLEEPPPPDGAPPAPRPTASVPTPVYDLPTAPVPEPVILLDSPKEMAAGPARRRRAWRVAAALSAAAVLGAVIFAATHLDGVPPTSSQRGLAPGLDTAPVPDEARLRIGVDGPARFSVDGRGIRPSSDGALHLPPGRHRITVTAPTLATARSFDVDLAPRQIVTRQLPRGQGRLRLGIMPAGTSVTVDGRAIGKTPLPPLALPEGEHELGFAHETLGLHATRRVVVVPGREVELALDLRRP